MSSPSEFSLRGFLNSFAALPALPRAFWIIIAAYVIESMAYFGILTLMTTFLSGDLRAPGFMPAQFVRPVELVARWEAGADPLSALVKERLGETELARLKSTPPAALPQALTHACTPLLHGPALYAPATFADAIFPATTGEVVTNLVTKTFGLLSRGDVVDFRRFALSLRHGSNGVARTLHSKLPEDARRELEAYDGTSRPSASLQSALVAGLNSLILGPVLYEETAFSGVEVPDALRQALRSGPGGEALARANRGLLEAASPDLLFGHVPATRKQRAYLNRLLLEAANPQYLAPGRPPGIGDYWAGLFVSMFTMLVTLFTIGLGSVLEKLGLRRAMLIGLTLCVTGRALYSFAPAFEGVFLVLALVLALLVNSAGPAITTPISYSGVKQYTDEKTNSMGYGLIYALMNLGIVGIGTLSAWIRPGVQDRLDAGGGESPGGGGFLDWLAGWNGSGVRAMNWVCVGITAVALVLYFLLMTRRTEAAKIRPDTSERTRGEQPPGPKLPWLARARAFCLEGPFGNTRFIFFIFMLLPVRTMFAHQWLTFPSYILRAYDKPVADKMEWLVNWINPGIIFIGVPILTALTRHINVYRMMMLGTLVSAAPTFLLCFGARLDLLIAYFVLFSIGEALWSARFYEYASELAPPGKVAQYMGLANIPWLLAKGTTGFYSGLMLNAYCPANTPRTEMNTVPMWIIYGLIALSTPIGLWLARKWVMAGLHPKPPKPAP